MRMGMGESMCELCWHSLSVCKHCPNKFFRTPSSGRLFASLRSVTALPQPRAPALQAGSWESRAPRTAARLGNLSRNSEKDRRTPWAAERCCHHAQEKGKRRC